MFLESKKKLKVIVRLWIKEKNQWGNEAGAGKEKEAEAETEKGAEAETEGGAAVETDAAAVEVAETEDGEGVVAPKDGGSAKEVVVPAEMVAGIEAKVNLGKRSFQMFQFLARYLCALILSEF